MAQEDVDNFIANAAYRAGIDHDKVVEILKFIVLQGRVTKDQLKSKFDLAENNQARPLLAVLETEKLLRAGRGYYPTAKLIEAYKILTRLTRLTSPEKESPRKKIGDSQPETPKILDPSFSDSVKDVKRVKNNSELKPSQAEPAEQQKNQRLIPCPFCAAQSKQMLFNSDQDLRLHVEGWHHQGADTQERAAHA